MSDTSEEAIIAYESTRNIAMDAYFRARPQMDRDALSERLFEAGFRMAWEYLKKE